MIVDQYRVEVRRLVHRRVLAGFLGIGAVVLVVVGISLFATTGSEPRYGSTFEDVDGVVVVERTFCPSSLVTSGSPFQYDCPPTTPTEIRRSTDYDGLPQGYFPWNGGIALFSSASLLLLWMLVGSLVGGEFRHGTVETALVAEPRRARLLALRLAAVLTVAVGTYLVLAVGYLVAIAPAWALHGIEGTTVPVSLVVAAIGRGVLLAVLVAAISASLAVIGRGALTSLGALVVLAVVAAGLFLFARQLVPVEFFTNAFAVLTGGDGYRAYQVDDLFSPWRFGAGWPWIATVVVITAYAVAVVAGAFVTFTRRDVR